MKVKESRIKLFYDSEFTSLSREGKLISMAFVSEDDHVFYAEFNDFPKENLNSWIERQVLSRLMFSDKIFHIEKKDSSIYMKDNSQTIAETYKQWIQPFGPIEIYADCPSYDWVFFCDLFGSAMNLPDTIYYIPFDLATCLKYRNIDPDISRENFVMEHGGKDCAKALQCRTQGKHNALYDAYIIKTLMEILEKGE